MPTYSLRTPAKVNLTLRVLARREDGFHELQSLFTAISLFDELRVTLRSRGHDVSVRVPGRPELEGPGNLVVKAAHAFAQRTSLRAAVAIELHKAIPMAAGLGGGSSDAAAVLRALCLHHGLTVRDPRVREAALQVGSDVPFFLTGRAALATGRGERLARAPALPKLPLVILAPRFGVTAKEAYVELARLRGLGALPKGRPAPLPPLRTPAEVAAELVNDLEAPVTRLYPAIASFRRALLREGALGARMSGSGSCVFGIFADAPAADAAAARLRGRVDAGVLRAASLRAAAHAARLS